MKFHRISNRTVKILGERAVAPDDIELIGRICIVKIKYSYDGHESLVQSTYEGDLDHNLLMIISDSPLVIRQRKYNNLTICTWLAAEDGSYCFWATYPTTSHFYHRWDIKREYKNRRVLIEKFGN